MKICIGDRRRDDLREESFLDGRYTVLSRSGLSPTEALVLPALPGLGRPAALLFVGNRTGVSALVARDLYPAAALVVHCLDLYHAHQVGRTLRAHPRVSIEVRCEPFIRPAPPFEAAFVQATPGGITGELLADVLEEIHPALAPGGRCWVAAEGKFPWLDAQLRRLFGNGTVLRRERGAALLVARKTGPLRRPRRHEAEFAMTMHGREPITLRSLPGVFAHRRVDEGAQALAEVVEARPGDTVLDMGCGCGVVGISIARHTPVERVVFVDANPRATYVTELNCRANGLTAFEVVLSDRGLDRENAFTLFAGNPPYFTDYKIAGLFVDTARRCLRPGGRAYLVAKNAAWHADALRERFGSAEIVRRRGYEVARAVRAP